MVGLDLQLDLHEEARARRFDLDPGLVLEDGEREVAIAAWTQRMLNEHVSARVFAALIPQLMNAGARASHQAEVARMIGEELRHGQLCAAVASSLGGAPVAQYGPLPAVPSHEDAEPLEALMRNVLSICCLSETVAVGHIEAERAQAGPAPLRAILDEILSDEVGHARFGWKFLEDAAPSLDPALRSRLTRYLAPAFEQLLQTHGGPWSAPGSDGARSIGICDGGLMYDIFTDTLYGVIVPGLEQHGLGAAEALAEAVNRRTSSPSDTL